MHGLRPVDLRVGQAEELPRTFGEFRGYHSGESILVCGCGASLASIVAPERLVTIGVNDVGRLFDPDYLVVLNPPSQFSHGRFQYVAGSKAHAIFTQLDLGIRHPHIVKLKLGRKSGTDFSDPERLPYTRNSPYPAVCLAAYMGARRIGLIGVDFTEHHFFGQTGRHSLVNELGQIDREYQQLYASCLRNGIEVFNLSEESRLTAFPKMSQHEFMRLALLPQELSRRRVFFVNYNFLSCGNVFRDGLAHAGNALGVDWKAAQWDDVALPQKVSSFDPDLLFVVHGRKFSARWRGEFAKYRSAVWLLDEPYEVDDTSRFSTHFGSVFVNDPNTLDRHKNAHYLPVCYDPEICIYRAADERPHAVGFIGGHNPQREAALARLARKGMLSYVVGGPWSDAAVNSLCLSGNIPADETARLYRGTRIVVNLFRTRHHFNRAGIPASSMNPRVYEALGCGALVISEYRPELDTICPELPLFRNWEEMETLIDLYLHDEGLFAQTRKACIRRVAIHTYARRLATVLSVTLGGEAEAHMELPTTQASAVTMPVDLAAQPQMVKWLELPQELAEEWEACAENVHLGPGNAVTLAKATDDGPGSERGLTGKVCYANVTLTFEVNLEEGAVFIAKLHQVEAHNQLSNSYHLICRNRRGYVARHDHVLARVNIPVGSWIPLSLSCHDGSLVVRKHGAEIARSADGVLPEGHCFIGVKKGIARVRNVRILRTGSAVHSKSEYELLLSAREQRTPKVSIVTTIYDRVECLRNCIQSVRALHFEDYEHIIVADCPPEHVMKLITDLVRSFDDEQSRLMLVNLTKRRNDWGMTPAAIGMGLARGRYVSFLSDDNGYMPNHFDKLVAALEGNPALGFVYSSCLYAGRAILNAPTPRPGKIDLGQPLIRRELFQKYFGGTFTFREFGWDWRMVERLMHSGVRWQHINEATFIFRLAMYPELAPQGTSRPEISYCVACYRPVYARQLIVDLIRKTTLPYEILLWLNLADEDFEKFVAEQAEAGAPIRVIGKSPENIGMAAYPRLLSASRSGMVAQIDDDVVCVSPKIGETAREIFDRFPQVGMLTADVWQDEYTTGARPPLKNYQVFDRDLGLYDGPIDGWFAVYRKSSLGVCEQMRPGRYSYIGCEIKNRLKVLGQEGLLCTRMKVFHVTDPAYVSYFGMLDEEIAKYRLIGREDQVNVYTAAKAKLPPFAELAERVQCIVGSFMEAPSAVGT
ncbi:MAG TPA: glycosyltransferase [Pseudacidobacterium sp.]|jgi:hypothetical protein|nr:glycosyltransferase [Pseudacidobacterium sp.]